jgi:hypothetical protein
MHPIIFYLNLQSIQKWPNKSLKCLQFTTQITIINLIHSILFFFFFFSFLTRRFRIQVNFDYLSYGKQLVNLVIIAFN